MRNITEDKWRDRAYRFIQEREQPYIRLRGSKIPYTNLHKSLFERMVKDFDTAKIGEFMTALYRFIYGGEVLWWYDKNMQNLWEDTLTSINKKADWWFEMKEKQEYTKILTEDNNKKI